jgi:ABC-type transport system substrate-binding protein
MSHLPDTLVDNPAPRGTSELASRRSPHGRHRGALIAAILIAASLALSHETATAQGGGTLRVAMTASDIPTTTGMPNNGFEGMRFLGYPIFEGLTLWDLTRSDTLAGLRPGLAEKWAQDKADPTKWIFSLRRGVKFHDGSDFNADAVIWNLERFYNPQSKQFETQGGAISRARNPWLKAWRKIDDFTVEISTNRPASYFPYVITYTLIASPTQFEKTGASWAEFAKAPAGTGPFKITEVKPRVSVELSKNAAYWDKNKIPKIDKMLLTPMPEPTTRLAALRSGQVDWIEVPPPDAIPQLKGAGFTIALNSYPHNWTHTLRLDKEPWSNKLVRKAANYAIDRVGICKSLLNDTCIPATGVVYKGHPWFGKAKDLLRQAGFDASKHPAKAVHLISTSGSGQMLPLAMNELIQKNLKDVGIDVDLQPVEWNTLLTRWRAGFKTPENEGLNAWNISWNFLEPWSGFGRFFHSKSVVPVAVNTMPYSNPEADKLIDEAERTFDVAKQNEILAKVHEVVVDDAPWIFVVHDQNPRALSPKVKGFVQPQSWFVDLTAVTVR